MAMVNLSASDQVVTALNRLTWMIAAARVLDNAARLSELIGSKANFNPNQPRVPRGSGRESGRWTFEEGWAREPSRTDSSSRPGTLPLVRVADDGFDPGKPPSVPRIRPVSGHARWVIVKEVARWAFRAARVVSHTTAIGYLIDAADIGLWLYDEYSPYIEAYLDEPKTLEELRAAAGVPRRGTDVHHIVERTQALKDYPEWANWIDGPENLVRISTLKHWDINRWFEQRNPQYGWATPRAFVRGKGRDVRFRVGLDALIEAGVLRP